MKSSTATDNWWPKSMYLQKILDQHRREASDREASGGRSLDQRLSEMDHLDLQPTRGFRRALATTDGMGVISEIKRRSPSKGDLNPGLDPASWAQQYCAGGATCLSVLTDSDFFGGSPDDLQIAREATTVPVLRKDFTVSAHDVLDARTMGADAVLLIVAALSDGELQDFLALARQVGLDTLVEVHDEPELERALSSNADLVGVNQRDLVSFEVDTDRACRVGRLIPDNVVSVAESGIDGPDDIPRLADTGFAAVLVGESLVKSQDPTEAVRLLRTAAR